MLMLLSGRWLHSASLCMLLRAKSNVIVVDCMENTRALDAFLGSFGIMWLEPCLFVEMHDDDDGAMTVQWWRRLFFHL